MKSKGEKERYKHLNAGFQRIARRDKKAFLSDQYKNAHKTTSPSSIHETGHSKPLRWDIPEGWDGVGGGREVQDGDACTPMADSCQCLAKTTKIL